MFAMSKIRDWFPSFTYLYISKWQEFISLFRRVFFFASVTFCKNKTLTIRFYFSIGRVYHMPSLGNYSLVFMYYQNRFLSLQMLYFTLKNFAYLVLCTGALEIHHWWQTQYHCYCTRSCPQICLGDISRYVHVALSLVVYTAYCTCLDCPAWSVLWPCQTSPSLLVSSSVVASVCIVYVHNISHVLS